MSWIPHIVIEACRPINFRGKARFLHNAGPNCGVRCARVFGNNFELDLKDFIQRQIYLGTFEPAETRIAKAYLNPGMTFVDVGANVGYYTALAASRVAGNGGRVVAYEPSPYAFERLHSMVLTNRLGHVTTVQAGLGDRPGRLNLYLGKGSDNHTPTMVAHENASSIDVSVATLDEEAERLGLERIDLIKIDVEGHEPKVLAGARQLLMERGIRAILCEFNEHWLRRAGSSPKDLEEIIRGAGFVEPDRKDTGFAFESRFFQLP